MDARKVALPKADSAEILIKDFSEENALAEKARIFEMMVQFPEGIPPGDWTEKEISYELPDKWRLSFGLYVDGVLQGFLFGSKREGRCHVHLFVVDRSCRGLGAGRLMIGEAMDRAASLGLVGLRLKINERNEAGLRFYFSCNFKLVDKGLGAGGEYVLLHLDHEEKDQ